jgi:hypothetical protein
VAQAMWRHAQSGLCRADQRQHLGKAPQRLLQAASRAADVRPFAVLMAV